MANPVDDSRMKEGYFHKAGRGAFFQEKSSGGRTYSVLKEEGVKNKSAIVKLGGKVTKKFRHGFFSKDRPTFV